MCLVPSSGRRYLIADDLGFEWTNGRTDGRTSRLCRIACLSKSLKFLKMTIMFFLFSLFLLPFLISSSFFSSSPPRVSLGHVVAYTNHFSDLVCLGEFDEDAACARASSRTFLHSNSASIWIVVSQKNHNLHIDVYTYLHQYARYGSCAGAR